MKVSARNVFKGHISALKPAPVNTEMEVTLAGGDALVAVVETESVEMLGLDVGKEVIALVKAPWVMLMTDSSRGLSARNCLSGTVRAVDQGAVNVEVLIALPGGTEVTAVVTREAVSELGLKPGVPATAVIKASDVILGVPD